MMSRAYKVIIVGGGISGLAAAHRLIEHGITDVLIVEAKDRLGGRVQTLQYGKRHIELGAQWIHGEGANPVLKLAHQCHNVFDRNKSYTRAKINCCTSESDNSEDETPDEGKCRSSKFFTQYGSQVPIATIGEVFHVVDKILDDAESFARKNIPIPIKYATRDSVGEFVREQFARYASDHQRKAEHQAILEWKLLFENSINGCNNLDELSLQALGEYCEFEGRQCVTLTHGYQPILDHLLCNISTENIRTKSVVSRILWSDLDTECVPKNGIQVYLTSGETLTTEYLIFTGSLGILKSKASEMFTPSLGDNKTVAIANLGFGVVDKIFLKFEEPFWSDNVSGIHFAWLPNKAPFHLECVSQDHVEQYGEWYKGITGFSVVPFNELVLMGWISGDEAVTMETIDETTVANICHELLERFIAKRIPKPSHIVRSRWGLDPDISGSYSFMKCGHNTNDCRELARPLPSENEPRLQLAGEACHHKYFSTTTGALMSGWDAADRLIHVLEN